VIARQLNLLSWMTRCDFKLRDQGTLLGFAWTLLNPILLFAVLYLVFSAWFDKLVDHYALYLMIGIIHWNFFSLATSNSVTIFERKRHMLKSFAMPALLVPASAVLTVFASYALEASIVLVLCGFSVGFSLSGCAWFAVLLVLHLALALGVSLFLSVAFISFRDISHLWGIALRIGFFITPVFYPLNVIDHRKLFILKFNPLYQLFNFSRQALLEGTVQVDWFFLYLIVVTVLLLIGSAKLYAANQARLVEQL
jgi:lipopolysaccharide transport system permease protein